MPDKKPTMTRAQIKDALAAGQSVAIAGSPGHLKKGDALPPPPTAADGPPEEDQFEAVIARTSDGRLTRAGMEHAIRAGGSVSHDGQIITDIDQLPDEAEIARHYEAAREQLARSYDEQIAALSAQKEKLGQSRETAPVRTRGPTAETHRAAAAEEDEGKHPAGKAQPKRG